jgi:protoheme IX farnesyltransferase
MITGQPPAITGFTVLVEKAKAYWELLKFRLSFLVAFSCAFGFVLAAPVVDYF